MQQVDLSKYSEAKPHYLKRLLWALAYNSLFRWLPGTGLRYIRNIILRIFGAKIPLGSLVYPSCKIWAPWNLIIGNNSCVGPNTELYNRSLIIIGDNAVISQGSHLYTASHDITDRKNPVVMKKIVICNSAWIAADCFVGMGVTIGEGAVVGARGCVFKDVEPWTVVGGNPARVIKQRIIKQ